MKLKYLKNIKDPSIAKEKYKWSNQIKTKLDYEKWIEYIDANQDYYTWWENTDDGVQTKQTIEQVPENFRNGVLNKLDKKEVLAEFNSKKAWYEIVIDFHQDFVAIHTTFMKKITKEHLKKLLEMANYLDGHLLNSGKTIIDEKVIEELE